MFDVKNIPYHELARQARASGACSTALNWLADGEKDLRTAYAQVTVLEWARYFYNYLTWMIHIPAGERLKIEKALDKFSEARDRAQRRWVRDTEPFWQSQHAALNAIDAEYKAERQHLYDMAEMVEAPDWDALHKEDLEKYNAARAKADALRAVTDDQIEVFNQRRSNATKRANAAELKFFKSLLNIVD